MKKTLSLLFALAFAFAATADESSTVNYGTQTTSPSIKLIWSYQTQTVGGVTYAVIDGVRVDGGANPTGELAVPVSIINEVTGDAYVVKGIAPGTFANQIGLTAISIPVTVETIGAGAFTGCTVLSAIEVDEDNPWFATSNGALYDKDRTKLLSCPARTETILLPMTLSEIGEEAFASCHRLLALNVPGSVTSIGARAFTGCTRLSSISFEGNAPAATADITQGANAGLVFYKASGSTGWEIAPWNAFDVREAAAEQPSGVISATAGRVTWHYRVVNGEAEIYNNGSAAIPTSTAETYTYDPISFAWIGDGRLVIPSSLDGYPVTRIGDYAFSGCSALDIVSIPKSVRKIGDYAFANCTGIGALTLPSGVQAIGYHPFSRSAITSLALPDSLRTLDGNPLAGCDTALSVTISGDNSYYAVVNGVLYDKDIRTLVGCPARKESVSIVSTVTHIGPEAFDGCFRLRAILLPDSLVRVGESAFRDATRLDSLVFPASVSVLDGPGLFEGCASLESVGFTGNAPAVDPHLFSGAPGNLVVCVAQGTTGWKDATATLPDSGKWPTDDAYGRTIANRNISPEPELKEGDVFVGVTTNGTIHYAYTLKVLANKGVEILGISPKPIGSFNVPSDFESSLGTLTVKSLGPQLFANAIGLLSVTIPNAVTNIGDKVFKDCSSLATVTLSHGLRSIGRHPFAGTAIETIALPDTVSAIDGNPIYGCDPSVSLSVGANNPYFAESTEGALYDKDFENLYAVPMTAEALTVPKSVAAIGDDAFAGCIRLKRVVFDGNAPDAADGDDLYVDCHASLTNFVGYGVSGFGDVPGTWHLRPTQRDPDKATGSETIDGVTWTYQLDDDGNATITGVEGATDPLVVPATLNGSPVVDVAPDALASIDGITSILSESEALVSRNGCLYADDGKTLVRVPDALELPYVVTTTTRTAIVSERIVPGLNDDGTDATMRTVKTEKPGVSTTVVAGTDITYDDILGGVTAIRAGAFRGCEALPDVETSATTNVLEGVTGFITGADGDEHPYVSSRSEIVEKTIVRDASLLIPRTVTDIDPHAFDGSSIDYSLADVATVAFARLVVRTEPPVVTPQPAALDENTSYAGWIERNGQVAGTFTAKTGRLRKGVLKFSGSALLLGEKKVSIRSLEQLEALGDIHLFADPAKSKAADAKAKLDNLKGLAWTMAFRSPGGSPLLGGYTTISVVVGAKGKVKFSGSAADGTRISSSAQAVFDGDTARIPATLQMYTGKKGGFALVLSIGADGALALDSLSDFISVADRRQTLSPLELVASARRDGKLAGRFFIDGATAESGYEPSETISEWKPRLTASTGLFKGFVYLYRTSDGRRLRANVNGALVDGVGYGSAVIKNVASWPVEVR